MDVGLEERLDGVVLVSNLVGKLQGTHGLHSSGEVGLRDVVV